ncbi:hypothetical protein B9Q11_04710 [Candidatus Marsarchaeota G2 archaeon ECH_B_SAG-F08]|uniref:malate synthase n=1 Tax=Candidatus Marsarchaeota G2 archaeon ECH_B_SAG-F08 TaxID=1978165 RepID=A0A2R6BFK4_9ARCH|nr:MAG: hypothetical protein B9Q11_04710 [Candidatus Marsarchaeota G2 archaeon ECH_B_SAG-F08]
MVVKINERVLKSFPQLFSQSVEQVIETLSRELEPLIEKALKQRRALLDSKQSVEKRYAFPSWDEVFEDPVFGTKRSFREIVQGLIDNFLGKETELSWRLNEFFDVPEHVFPLKNAGLEITGPWEPVDMAIKQINADVCSTMGPDDEDAAPADFVPFGAPSDQPIPLFASRDNERRILKGEIFEVSVSKKGEVKTYRIEKPRESWPPSFHRVPGMHLRTFNVFVDGKPANAMIVDYVIHALNDFESLRKQGRLVYYYQPKVQTPLEAYIVAKIVWSLERLLGAQKPGSIIKFKALYEEANLGRFLPVVMWMWRYWLIGTNVGRWDYTASLIEMWKDERVLSDPQNSSIMGMTSPHMMAYQRYNALLNLMASLKHGEVKGGAPIGGMAAVMLYQQSDAYSRHRHNPVTLRAMWLDKLRERLIGLIFVCESRVEKLTLEDALKGRVKGRLYDLYRQSWVASPDKSYVEAGNIPLRTPLEKLQELLDAPEEWVEEKGVKVAPSIKSGLTQSERALLSSLRLLDQNGKITPWVISKEELDSPEKLFSSQIWQGRELWSSLYDIPSKEITIENVQHAFYMAANYGFQVLNGNLAAAIDDYVAFSGRVVRFMNDLATYRIFVSWLWCVIHNKAKVTKDGWLKAPLLTQDGVIPAKNAIFVKAGSEFTNQLFEELWKLHNEWTHAFFEDYDRTAALRIIAACVTKERDALVQLVNSLLAKNTALDEIVKQLSKFEKASLLLKLEEVREIVSRAYGAPPGYKKEISYEEAAEKIASTLGVTKSLVLKELEASSPRFDRSKAPVIMDVLKRQLLCPLYVQHSARVLFVIADKSEEERENILSAVFYADRSGKPLFRDSQGKPSREKLVEAVKRGEAPNYALEAHDYIYDYTTEAHDHNA